MYIRDALRMGCSEEPSEPAKTRWDLGISFELAALVFEDEGCPVYEDSIDGRTEEQRWHAVGAVQI